MFQENGYKTCVATNFKDFEKKLAYCNVQYDVPFERNPFKLNNLTAYSKIKKIIADNKFEIIHCHTPVGSVLTRLAARKYRKNGKCRVIYTAHGFHFYKGAPLINWLLYFPAEWICSFFTDVLITINKEDYEFAKKHLHAERTEYVPGVGIDLEKFSNKISDEEKQRIRAELDLMPEDKLILSVGELNRNKNHEIVIRALGKLHDQKLHYAIAGKGELKDYLQSLAKQRGVKLYLLGFRTDVKELYQSADMFVFPSKREGLSVALMEAIASKTPVLCSKIRGNTDLVTEENLFDLNNIRQLTDKISSCSPISATEENFANLKPFSLETVTAKMRAIYEI
ncbi:MAG: glycosyltransferase [Synergistaceae bacterium]|nr:glycosyltransferase [Candidatus Equadaptatus faecalis]